MKKIDTLIAINLIILLFCIFINKFTINVLFMLVMLLILKMLKEKNKKFFLLLTIIVCIGLYNYKISSNYFNLGYNILNNQSVSEYLLNVIGYIIMLYVFSNKNIVKCIYDKFKKMKKILFFEIFISQVFILFLFITGKGFSIVWNMKVFIGSYYSPHQYAYSLIIMCIAIEFLRREMKNKLYNFLYIIPLITGFLTGARTPMLIMILIITLIKIFKRKRSLYDKYKYKDIFVFIFIGIFITILSEQIIHAILNSTIIDKFNTTFANGNLLNSRDSIWNGLLDAYDQFSIFEKLFGHGIYYSVVVNRAVVKSEIWGHSDFIDILISYGGIMLTIYVAIYLRFFYFLKKNGMNIILTIGLAITLLCLSMFNGIVNYSIFIPIVCYISLLSLSIEKTNMH